jgi:hypothetical protein
MKRTVRIAISALSILATTAASAQTYSLDWYTIDGGGAQALTAGGFTLSGTIGQPDAGMALKSGGFELVGGFWTGFTVEPFCYGDLDGDGYINLNDLAQLLGHYGKPGVLYEDGDLNEDGVVNLDDLAEMLSLYGDPCP